MTDVIKEVGIPVEAGKWKRPGVPKSMPLELADLMQECWHQNPARRPTFTEIEGRLRNLDDGPGSIVDKMVAKQKLVSIFGHSLLLLNWSSHSWPSCCNFVHDMQSFWAPFWTSFVELVWLIYFHKKKTGLRLPFLNKMGKSWVKQGLFCINW